MLQIAEAFAAPLHAQLADAVVRRAALPAGFVTFGEPLADGGEDAEEEDDFNRFRIRLKDVLQNCIAVLQVDMLRLLGGLLSAELDWMRLEAVFFAYSCIGHPVRRMVETEQIASDAADQQLELVFTWVLGPAVQIFSRQPVAQCTASNLVRAALVPQMLRPANRHLHNYTSRA